MQRPRCFLTLVILLLLRMGLASPGCLHGPFGHNPNTMRLVVPGDIMIGALLPLHAQPSVRTAYSRRCGQVREEYGIHRVEGLLHAIHEVNRDHRFLPNLTLGLDGRDTCWSAPIALRQCMTFIRNAIAYRDFQVSAIHRTLPLKTELKIRQGSGKIGVNNQHSYWSRKGTCAPNNHEQASIQREETKG